MKRVLFFSILRDALCVFLLTNLSVFSLCFALSYSTALCFRFLLSFVSLTDELALFRIDLGMKPPLSLRFAP